MASNVSEKVQIRIEKSVKKVSREVVSRASRVSNALRNAELRVLSGQRSGKVYKKPHSRATYTASAPGEAPARRTGDLRKSFAPYVESTPSGRETTIRSGIRSNVEYADILENGRGRMARRPYRDRIIEKAKPEAERIFREPYNL